MKSKHRANAAIYKWGRPTKKTPRLTALILKLVSQGLPFTHCCAIAKISKSTFNDWRRESEFAAQLEQALAQGVDKRLKAIEKAIENDWRAAAWWLEHVLPDQFGRTRVQIEAVGAFDHAFVIPQDTLDKIAEARKEYEQKQIGAGGT